jgi:hypothetical protein
MDETSYHIQCLSNILNGVSDRLSKFSHPSRLALIYAPSSGDSVNIFDLQNILRGHDPKLKELFVDNFDEWNDDVKARLSGQSKDYHVPQPNLELSGLISYGSGCNDFFYQMWSTDHHPDMCSIHPTERWFEQAAAFLAFDYHSKNATMNSSDYVLKNYSLQALSDYIVDERTNNLDFDSRMLISPILNDILDISKTKEEGAWERGTLFFTDSVRILIIDFLTKIQKNERPEMGNRKHIRKLFLAVENSSRKLVSDGCNIIGISERKIPDYAIVTEFTGKYGFLKLGNKKISSFFDGSLRSTTQEAKMVELEELLLDSILETKTSTILFQVVSHLVHKAGGNGTDAPWSLISMRTSVNCLVMSWISR